MRRTASVQMALFAVVFAAVSCSSSSTGGKLTYDPLSLSLTEGGAPTTFTVWFDAAPSAPVTVNLSSSDTGAVTVSPASITIDANNFATHQTVTVTAVADDDVANESATISLKAGDQTASIAVTVKDKDVQALNVDVTTLAVNEGATGAFTVKLARRPGANVSVSVTSANAAAATVAPATLTFTPDNFGTAQTVTVSGVQDANTVDDTSVITVASTGVASQTVTVTVADRDMPGFTLTPTTLSINEGATGTFTVKMNSAVTADTTVTLTSSGSAATVSPATLTFTAANSGTAQTVTVTGVKDDDATNAMVTITAAATGLTSRTVQVTVVDLDTVALSVTPTTLALNEGGTTGTLAVKLTAQPSADVVVTIATSDATAAAPSTQTLTFTATTWDTAQDVTVAPVDDADLLDETLTLTVSATGLASVTVPVTVHDDDSQALLVSAQTLTVLEGASATFAVQLAYQPAGNVTVTLSSSNTAATTTSPATLTFTPANYAAPQTVTVNAPQDANTVSENTTITVASTGLASATVAVSVTDDDVLNIALTPTSLSVTEGGTPGTFTVALTQQPTANVTVSLTSSNTAAATISPATLTFTTANYATAQTVTVTAVQDNNVANESVTVTAAATGVASRSVTVSVTDDDVQAILATPLALTVNEGANRSFTLRLAYNPSSTVSITVTSSNTGSITATPGTVTFDSTNWNVAQSVTLNGVEDVNLVDEAVLVTASTPGLTPAQVSVAVVDNDTQTIVVSPASLTVGEGATGTFTTALAFQPVANVTIAIATSNALAATAAPATLVFTPANYATPQTVTVTGVQDANVTNEVATLTLSSSNLADANVGITVTDDDVLNLSLTPGSLALTEGGAAGTFAAVLTQQPSSNVVVTLTSSRPTSVTASPATVTFTTVNWATPQTVTVTAIEDNNVANETVTVTGSATGLTSQSVSVSVTDNDTQAIQVSSSTVAVGEGGTATFTARLAYDPGASVNLTVSSGNTSSLTASPGTVTFDSSNWSVPRTITLSGVEDVNLANESVSVTLASPVAASVVVTANVTDNDTQAFAAASSLTVTEGATGTFGLALAFQPAGTVTVTIGTSNALVATASPVTLTFNAADYATPKPVTVSGVIDANLTNDTANITLTATGITAGAVAVTVTDRDTQNIVVSPSTVAITEGGAAGSFSVSLTNQPSSNVTVNVLSTDTGAVTVSLASLTFTSVNWNVPQPVSVTGVQDNDVANESVAITASSASLASRTVTVTVTDDDTQAIVASASTVALNEGGTATFTVRLAFNPLSSVSVNLSSSNGGSATVSPTTLSFDATNYSTPQTVTLTGVQDINLANEVVTVTLSSASIANTLVTVNVTDNDTQAISLSAPNVTVNEGGTATLTVALGFQPLSNVSLTVASSNALKATASPTTFNFTPVNFATPQTVTISGQQDVDLLNESVTLTFTGAGAADANALVTVIDDDAQSFVVNPTSVALTEGGATGSFNVHLAFAPTADVTVTLASSDPGAIDVTPTTLTFTAMNYTADQAVTLTGVTDVDTRNESGQVLLTASGIPSAQVNVTVTDDDVQALAVSTSAVTVTEEGAPGTFTVALAFEPNADVVVDVATADPGAVARSPAQLTFTVANYSTPQTVSVSGISDPDLQNELVNITLTTAVAPSATVAVTVNDDDVQDLVVSKTSMTVTEDTAPGTFTIRLAYQPQSDVTVTVATSDAAAAGASPSTLIFTPLNYGAVRTVTVSGTSDQNMVGTSATLSVDSLGLPSKSIAVTVLDDDTQSIVLSNTGITMLEGSTATFTARLAFEPLTGSETVTLVSPDMGAVTIAPTTLSFTTASYATPQLVTATGVQDPDVLNETVVVGLTSSAAGTPAAAVTVTVTDDDVQQIVRNLSSVVLTEGGAVGTVNVHLLQDPAGTAVVNVSSDDTGAASVAPATLSFNSGNYTVDQVVTVSPVSDDDVRNETVTVTYAATGIASQTTVVTVNDDDTQAVLATPASLTVVEESTGTVAVKLAFRPTSDVTVSAVSNDTAHITVSPATLTFTSSNFDQAQNLTLTGVADENLDDNNGITVTLSSSAGTAGPEGSPNVSVSVNETDNDLQQIIVTVAAPLPLSVQEGGPTAAFKVHLQFPPKGGVDDQVSLTPAVAAKLGVNPATLVFTTVNFGSDQSVAVQGRDDADTTQESINLVLAVVGETPPSTATQAVRIMDDEVPVLGTASYSGLTGGTEFTPRGNIAFGTTGFAITGHDSTGKAQAAHDSRDLSALTGALTIGDGLEGTPQVAIFDGTGFGLFSAASGGVRYTREAEDFSSTLLSSTTLVSGVDDFWPAWNGTGYGLVYRLPPNDNLFFRSVNVNGTVGSAVQVTTATGAAHRHPNAHFVGPGYVVLYSTATEVRCARTSATGVPQGNLALSGMPASVPFLTSVYDGSRVVAAYIDPSKGLFLAKINPTNCAVESLRRVRGVDNYLNTPHIAFNGVEFAVSYDISGTPNQVGVALFDSSLRRTEDTFPLDVGNAGERPSMAWLGDRWGLRVKGDASARVLTGSFQDLCGNGALDTGETSIDCGGPTCGACQVSEYRFQETSADDVTATSLADFFNTSYPNSSDFIYVGPYDKSYGKCMENAAFYADAYRTNISGGTADSGNWNKWYLYQGGSWTGPVTNTYRNYFGTSCWGTSGSNAWCYEWGMGPYFRTMPGNTGFNEAYADSYGGYGSGTTIRVGPDRNLVCGF